jgi:hypothetical protein
MAVVGGIVDPSLHGWKTDALHDKVLHTVSGDALIDFWDSCVRKELECCVEESLRITFIEDALLVKINDIIVEDGVYGGLDERRNFIFLPLELDMGEVAC